MRHTVSGMLLAAALALGAAGAAHATKDVVVGLEANLTGLDPADLNDNISQSAARLMFEGLYMLDEHMKLRPQLAESYEASEVLLYERALEPTAALILWQIGVIGNMSFTPEGDTTRVQTFQNFVSPRYLESLSIPLLLGRQFSDHDEEGAPQVAIINQTLAGRLWPNENALGRRLRS